MAVNKLYPPAPATYGHPALWDTPISPRVMHEIFADSARQKPDGTLVDFLGRGFTYRHLYTQAQRFAVALANQGLQRGDRVGLFLPNVPTYVAAYYGAKMAGMTVVNFSPLYTVEELAHQVEDLGTRLLVTLDVPALLPTAIEVLDSSSLEKLAVAHLADALPPLKGIGLRLFGRGKTARIPTRPDVSAWDAWQGDWEWSDWISGRTAKPASVAASDLALLQYTGGTTGRPKGAMLTHANLSSNAMQVDMIDPFDRSEPDVVMGALPLFHVFANTCVLNRTVLHGGTIVMLPRFDAGQVLKAIDRAKPRAFPGVPTMFQALLDHKDFDKTDWSAMRICISGGAPMPAKVRDEFEARTGVRLVEGYGLTESSGVVSTNPYKGQIKPGTIGQPVAQTEICCSTRKMPQN